MTAGVVIRGAMKPGYEEVLAPEAIEFAVELEREFGAERRRLLARRAAVQRRLDAGWKPDFLLETKAIRDGGWRVAPIPRDLQDRRVEITGPTDRKMVINALNCGANVFMADFEDANTPTWDNLIEGQANLSDAVRRTIAFDDPQTGRHYSLNGKTAVLFVRPRGWHLPEKHVLVDGEPMSGALFDFALFFFHNAKELVARGAGPYFYLPKLESHLEARLWNNVFLHAQSRLGLPKGTIRATVLIETIMAAFEMDEILWELRDHSAGLNCGRWDYIFSFIKKLAEDPNCVMPDRGQVTMTTHFLRSYSQLLIKTCHRREIHAMGGMAAQIPIRDDPAANEAAMAKVRADKEREAGDGHDGTWVAHPGLVAVAKEIFDREMPQPNQIARKRQDVQVTASDLLAVPQGTITEAGLRQNLNVGIGYIEAWLRGIGCVPLYNLMEDAATAEISRAQIWQWIRHGVQLDDGRTIDRALCRNLLDEELAKLRASNKTGGCYEEAAELFSELTEAPVFPEFLTMPAYDMITTAA
ncbi:MAG TPA: malate synthase A [Stellaceae bacterium]|jgi:malate synthase|nr:malate synthase A [Stellaceae bacterium]